METVVLGFGSNLGARAAWIDAARALLAAQPGLAIRRTSALYATPPLGPPQPDYLNAAAVVEYAGAIESLLTVTQHVETLLLRTRAVRWGPRTLDLDLLAAQSGRYASPRLALPHPGLWERGFALAPLRDVAADWHIPGQGEGPTPDFPPRCAHPVRTVRDASGLRIVANDLAEWLSAIIAAMVEIACLCTARASAALPRARATLPFRMPSASPGAAAQLLCERVSALFEAGFSARCGVVAELGPSSVSGLFVGEHSGGIRLPRVNLALAARGEFGAERYGAHLSLA